MNSSDRPRADKMLARVQNAAIREEYSDSGLPEFRSSPKLLVQYVAAPTALKRKPANGGHVMVLAKAYAELAAELKDVKKALGRR